jgi:chromosome segregation ATPase
MNSYRKILALGMLASLPGMVIGASRQLSPAARQDRENAVRQAIAARNYVGAQTTIDELRRAGYVNLADILTRELKSAQANRGGAPVAQPGNTEQLLLENQNLNNLLADATNRAGALEAQLAQVIQDTTAAAQTEINRLQAEINTGAANLATARGEITRLATELEQARGAQGGMVSQTTYKAAQDEVTRLRQQVAAQGNSTQEVATLRQQTDQLTKQLREALESQYGMVSQATHKRVQDENAQLNAQLAQARTAQANMVAQADYTAAQNEIARLTALENAKNAQIAQLEANLQNLTRDMGNLQNQSEVIRDLQAQLAALSGKAPAQVQRFIDEIDNLRAEKETLVRNQELAAAKAKEEVNNAWNRARDKAIEANRLNDTIETQKEQMDDLRAQIKALEDTVGQLQELLEAQNP